MAGTDPLVARMAGAAGTAVRVLWQAAPGLLGLGLVSVGAWMAWPPAGLLTAGGLLLADRIADRRGTRP